MQMTAFLLDTTKSVTFPIDKVKATNPVKKIVVIDSLSNGAGKWTITKHPISLVEPSIERQISFGQSLL